MNHMVPVVSMPSLAFTPDMATGIRAIDNDHRMLIDIANALTEEVAAGNSKEKLGAALDALIRYVEEHFRREEKMLTDCAYPQLAAHMREHQNLSRSVYEIHHLFRTHPEQVPWGQVTAFLANWLKSHILQTDMAYVECVRNFDGTKNGNSPLPIQPLTLHVTPNRADLLFRCSNLLLEDGEMARLLEEAVTQIEERQSTIG
ncbi:MAG: hemerythrin family protein [Alphaproteobacteria bacterium]|nr:hemerythrin family protein [Alphaproteobacteria bacterium]